MKAFYHSADLDGHCSGAIVKLMHKDCTMIPIDYGDKFPYESIQKDEFIFMVDFSLQPFDRMINSIILVVKSFGLIITSQQLKSTMNPNSRIHRQFWTRSQLDVNSFGTSSFRGEICPLLLGSLEDMMYGIKATKIIGTTSSCRFSMA